MFVTVANSCTGQDRPGRLRSHRRAFRSVQQKNYQTWNENNPEIVQLSTPKLDPLGQYLLFRKTLLCIVQTRVLSAALVGPRAASSGTLYPGGGPQQP